MEECNVAGLSAAVLDHAAPEALLVQIEHYRLTWRNSALRAGEFYLTAVLVTG